MHIIAAFDLSSGRQNAEFIFAEVDFEFWYCNLIFFSICLYNVIRGMFS